MDIRTAQLDLLIDLEARHEELLLRLDELDKRVEKALADSQSSCLGPGGNPPPEGPIEPPTSGP